MIIAIDLGGRTAKIGFLNEDGKLLHKFSSRTVVGRVIESFYEDIMEQINNLGIDYNRSVSCIGFGCVGPIDQEKGVSILCGRTNWHNYPAKAVAERLFKKPVFLQNDARSAILGEYWQGSAKNHRNVIGYTIGSGIGGGIIINNELYSGSHNWAGEFGHGGYMQTERECSCGLKTCIEGLSSCNGIDEYIKFYIKRYPSGDIAKLAKEKHSDLSIKEISPLLHQNNREAKEILLHCLKPLVSSISAMAYAFDPDVIIVGGGPSEIGKPLLDLIQHMLSMITQQFVLDKVKVKLMTLGNDAGMYGVAYWAMMQSKKHLKTLSKN